MGDREKLITVERVQADEFGAAARILADAFVDDPVLAWALPRAETRLADAVAFFNFRLRRSSPERTDVYATSDRSAVAILTLVEPTASGCAGNAGPVRARSPVADYIGWIETFRPALPHRYLEFIGISPAFHAKGRGSLLLGSLVERYAGQGLPVWCWSSNPRNLSFYGRLGFEAGPQLRRDAGTPAVTPLLCPVRG